MGKPLTYAERAIRYARAVLGDAQAHAHYAMRGRSIDACVWVKAAAQRQLDDLERAARGDESFPYVFSDDHANHVCTFIEVLPHVKGRWGSKTIELEDWQCFILATVFGWYHKETGLRRFRWVYIEVPRKNAKSTLSAGVALYMLALDQEMGAEVYTAATTREQARIVWDVAAGMVRAEKRLQGRFGVEAGSHAIFQQSTSSTMKALAADHTTLDGLNPSCAIIDELHAHKTRAVHDVIETAMGARTQPLLWEISTAGSNREGVCYEVRAYLTRVLNATLYRHDGLGYPVRGAQADDETMFGVIYSIDDADDWSSEQAWEKANPNFGVSVGRDDFARLAAKAMSTPTAQNNFLTKRLNVWVNAATAWMDMRAWDACADPDLRIEELIGAKCVVAVDLASRVDLAARAAVFERDGIYYAFGKYYIPEVRAQADEGAHFAGWAAQGWIDLTPGDVTDFDLIEDDIRADVKKLRPLEVAYDSWQAQHMANHLTAEGAPMVEMPMQVRTLSEPMKMLEALVLSKRFRHNGDPVLTWAVSNVVAHRDKKDNLFPRKETDSNKIDPAVAVIMALGRLLLSAPKRSVYDTRGVLRV